MKNLIYIFLVTVVALGISSCNKKEEPQKWEYKTIEVWGDNYGKFSARTQPIPKADLDALGAHGWELVSVYTLTETVHPNFGNEQYVTGLQPNTRTSAVCYVFKRPITETSEKNVNAADSVAVEEVATEAVADTCDVVTE